MHVLWYLCYAWDATHPPARVISQAGQKYYILCSKANVSLSRVRTRNGKHWHRASARNSVFRVFCLVF